MNVLFDWMICGLLYLLEITLCMRSQGKVRSLGMYEMGSRTVLGFLVGEGRSLVIEIVGDAPSKSSPHHTLRLRFQGVTQDSNRFVNVTGTASRPNCKRES